MSEAELHLLKLRLDVGRMNQMQMDQALWQPQRRGVGRIHREMDQRLHLQHDVYPAYISWGHFLANQGKLRENSTYLIRRKENRLGPARVGWWPLNWKALGREAPGST